MKIALEVSCPWLAARWDREVRGAHPSEENACYLWDECGVPPDVVEYCAGTLPWHGERFVPVPVETQWSVCLTEHYGSCRWLRERQWYKREQTLVCPLLGSEHDRHHKNLYPSTINYCHARKNVSEGEHESGGLGSVVSKIGKGKVMLQRSRPKWKPLSADTQKNLCLTSGFVDCEFYQTNLRDH
ncbi:MAG: hypothetical protein M1358_24505 [Chloroflexi bacterium]|nr:hypothetical protein [Chloroflexota bacterium]